MRLTYARKVALTGGLAAALAFVPAAAANPVVLAPPGKAGANQYFETIPSSSGNAAPPSGTSTKTPPVDRVGPAASALKQLQKSGSDGRAAASFATSSAPHVTATRHRKVPSKTAGHSGSASHSSGTGQPKPVAAKPSPAASAASTAGGSALGGVFDLISGSDTGGIGVLMPVLLIGGLVGAIVAAGLRRRGETGSRQPWA